MVIGEELDALGEALPELGSGLVYIPAAIAAADAYNKSDLIVAIPLTLCEVFFSYILYKGILRGNLFYRWTRRNDYPDPLKMLYNKIKEII